MLWNSGGTLFYLGCQWLLTVLVVRFRRGYLDAGVLSLAMSIANVLAMVASLNLRTFQVSELDRYFSDGDFLRNRLLASGVALALCICIVLYRGYDRYDGICIVSFMIFKIFELLGDVFHGIDQKAWRLDIAGKSFVLRGITTLASIACGIFVGGNLIVTIILMTLSVLVITFFYDFKQCEKQVSIDFSYEKSHVLELLKIGFPLMSYSFFLNLILAYPRFQIEEQYGKELLGIFSSIVVPTVLITQLASLMFSPLMGVFAEFRKGNNKKGLYELLAVVLCGINIIGILSIVVGRTLGEWALILLFGESIREYMYLLVPIIITAILSAIIWLFCGLLTVFKDYYMLAVLTLISLLVCLIIAPVLVAEEQLIGAVFVLLITLSLEVFLLGARLVRLLRRKEFTQ